MSHRQPHVGARRIQELRSIEARATAQDLMHTSTLEKFQTLGIDMMPRMEGAHVACVCGDGRLRQDMTSRPCLFELRLFSLGLLRFFLFECAAELRLSQIGVKH